MQQKQNDQSPRKRNPWLWALIAVPAALMSCVVLCVVLAIGVVLVRHRVQQRNVITTVSPLPVGSSTHAITVDGRQRTYIVYRPAGLTGSAPLVVMLHGGFGSASQAEKSYGWNDEADRQNFLVAYPDGVSRAWNTGGGCCGIPASQGIDDVAFIRAMVEQIEQEAAVDQSRIYATGISNGGMMAYTLACRTTIFAAIGPDSATQLGPCGQPDPVSVIHIHGTADTRIRYDGGRGNGTAHIDGPAIPDLNATWRTIDQCDQPLETTSGPITMSTAGCANGRTVELITIDGAGHQWPGSKSRTFIERLLGLDAPSTALNATDTFWQFFAQHHK